MAQLPPKVPTQNWPFQKSPTSMWVDEFLDFSSARRGSHRRSASEGVAFLEAPTFRGLEECRTPRGEGENNNGGYSFEKLDDDQLMSMFNDDEVDVVSVTVENPSSTTASSERNSNNEEGDRRAEPKPEPGEAESEVECSRPSPASSGDAVITDPKRVKRILANRQSAQRSRVRKLQYISELERTVSSLQTEVSTMSPRVAFLDHQRLILNVDNSALKQRIAALAQDKIFKDAHQEALKKEIERLRQVYQQQGLKKMNNNNNNNQSCNNNNGTNESIRDNNMICTDSEQLLIN